MTMKKLNALRISVLKASLYHVDFLHGTPMYTELSLSEEEQRNYSSSASISPMEEETLLPYSSSHSPYFMISPNQPAPQMPGSNLFEYFPSPQDYGSGSDSGHHSLMYASTQVNGHPLMTSGSNYSSTSLSPTSSISSGTLHNFAAAAITATAPNLYLQVSNGGMGYEMEDSVHQESGSSNSNSDESNGFLPEYHAATRPYKTSSSESCASGSNNIREHSATMASSHPNRSGNRYSNNDNKEHKFAPSRDCVHGKRVPYPKGQARDKPKKRCSNCHSVQSPSWRRSILKPTKGNLLCNACGL